MLLKIDKKKRNKKAREKTMKNMLSMKLEQSFENIDNKWTIHTYLNFKQTLKLFDKVPDKILKVTPRQRNGWSFSGVDGDYVSKDAWIAFAKNFLGIKPPQQKQRKPRDPNKGYKKPEYINPDMKGGTYFDGDTQVYEMPEEYRKQVNKYN